jgi:type VI secretion system protein ImpI
MPSALVARVVDTQANQSFEVTFERFPVRIGRNQLNDLPIDRPYVSQFHAAIDVQRESQILLKDLGSTNGTLYQGQRLPREQVVDITALPELTIGPVVIRLALVPLAARTSSHSNASILDMPAGIEPRHAPAASAPAAHEDPYLRQLLPYVEAYRQSWQGVYRLLYDHLTRLQPEHRAPYLRRVGVEHPGVTAEPEFVKLAKYYGLDPRTFAHAGPGQAALAALAELTTSLAPGSTAPDDVASVMVLAKRLRDTMEVFLKAFISLRDGYQEFETEVLAREKSAQEPVSVAKDAAELGNVLFGSQATAETARALQMVFVDVMSHQVALMNGVMEGVKQLLQKLSPQALEGEFERSGKKGGLFSNRFEALWKLYELRHGDYAGEDKETFLIIFGPQFSRAYSQTTGEQYQGEPGKLPRRTVMNAQRRP